MARSIRRKDIYQKYVLFVTDIRNGLKMESKALDLKTKNGRYLRKVIRTNVRDGILLTSYINFLRT